MWSCSERTSATGTVDFHNNEVRNFTEPSNSLLYPNISGPPPLMRLPTASQVGNGLLLRQAAVVVLSSLKLLQETWICQGCRRSLQLPDGSIPPPPFDLVIARMARRTFYDATGVVRTPTRPSAAHYHLNFACIRAVNPHFVSDVQL